MTNADFAYLCCFFELKLIKRYLKAHHGTRKALWPLPFGFEDDAAQNVKIDDIVETFAKKKMRKLDELSCSNDFVFFK